MSSRILVLAVALWATQGSAEAPTKRCQRICKAYVAECEKQCVTNKNAKWSKPVPKCQKGCRTEQEKVCLTECAKK